MASYQPPAWYSFPPYFTLQPVRETRERQLALWREFIVDYCRAHRTFVVSVEEDTALFVNSAINRKLNLEARRVVLAALVEDGRAQWLGPQRCLVHWRSPQEWGASIYGWATAHGLEGGVTTLNELAHGEDTQGQGAWIHLYTYGIVSATAGIMLTSRWAWMPPDFHGIQADALAAALKCLELDGKAKVFTGAAGDDPGVKFFASR